MRFLYSLLFSIALPGVISRLIWRSFKNPAYRHRIGERLGYYTCAQPLDRPIWFHAVSVGEVEAVYPLINAIQQLRPSLSILVTTTTPTGSARVKALLAHRVIHVYFPYDIPSIVQRFLRYFKPQLVLIMETEIWPNVLFACKKAQIPVWIINARLSEKSVRSYQKIAGLTQLTLSCVDRILTQSDIDSTHFAQIGATVAQIQQMGNLKFDLPITDSLLAQGVALRSTIGASKRFVVLLASTHVHEDEQLLSLYSHLKPHIPNLLLLIAPRHPERFSELAAICLQQALPCVRRSSGQPCRDETAVYLIDSLGELKLFYATADLSFVGGSLVDKGGHNVLEPAAIGCPVLFGPYMRNFQRIADDMLANNAAIQCADVCAIAAQIIRLYQNTPAKKALCEQAKTFLEQHKGVVARIAHSLIDTIDQPKRQY